MGGTPALVPRHERAAQAPLAAEPVRRPPTWVERAERYLLRLTVLTAYVGVLALVYFLVSPVLPESARPWEAAPPPTAPQPAVVLPQRPATAPARIPEWAWAMHSWHLTPPAERGERPAAAPTRLPAWYWEWRQWRLALAGG